MNISLIIGIVLGIIPKSTFPAKILGIFPYPGGSHNILACKLLAALAEDGHEITFIAPYPTKNVPKNYVWEDVVLDGLMEEYYEHLIQNNFNMYEDSKMSPFEKTYTYHKVNAIWINNTLHHPKVRDLMAKHSKFDVVIIEEFLNSAHKYFGHYFDAPLVILSSVGPFPAVNNILRSPLPSSYVPHVLTAATFDFQKFSCRVKNFFANIIFSGIDYFIIMPFQNKLLQQAFPGAPPISELDKRVALVLLNSHESLVPPVPLVPTTVSIGGYHIDPPKALPQDLQQFLDSANDGVVYCSMGSNLKAKDMTEKKKQIFFNVFKKLRQKVLWKFEDENLKGLPTNVFVMSWVPQQNVLAHPNVKLFITHGGQLSTTETIHHGIPVLTIPIFADQFANAQKAVEGGYGLKIGYNDESFTEEALAGLINELLTNRTYSETVKRRSKMYHDRPLTPKQNLVYWVNYVIRYKGAEHLKVAGVHLPLYQYLMLDILIPLVILLYISIYISFRVIGYICSWYSRSGQTKAKKLKTG